MSGTTGVTGHSNGDKWLQKDIVKKSPNAQQILEVLPIKFKKMVRQLIDFYEDEKIQLLQERIESPRTSLELYAYKQKLEQLVKENTWQLKQIETLKEKERSLNFQLAQTNQLLDDKERELRDCHHIVESINNALDFQRQTHQNSIGLLSHQNLLMQITIKKLKEKNAETNGLNQKLKEKIQIYNKQIITIRKQLADTVRARDQAYGKVQKLTRDMRKKKIVQIRTSLSATKDQQTPKTPGFQQYQQQDFLRTSCFRKLSQAFSPTIKMKSTKSINQTIRKAKQIIGNKVEIKQQQPSEPDSIEFGKEKVIEKKKVRKILSQLINAADSSKRRIVLEQLAGEIGLRQVQIDLFLDLF